MRERWEKHRRLILGGLGVAVVILLAAGVAGALDSGEDRGPQSGPQGESDSPSLNDVNSTADQYELAREIGYDLCADPIYPDRAAADPVGYAEEEFGGSGEFDSAREAGCLEALGQ